MLFCERAFGLWFLFWGLTLIADRAAPLAIRGLFLGHLESYMPGWAWGLLFICIALARWLAHWTGSRRWRIWLSAATFVVLVVVASVAAAARLFGATVPLAAFAAYVAWWCHRAMIRDSRLGL